MRTNSRLARRLAGAFAAAVLGVTGLLVASATPAQAATTHSPCAFGDMCYYYASGFAGAQTGVFDWGVPDEANPPIYFYGGGSGSGKRLWNDAGSGYNADQNFCVGVYYSQNYGTPAMYLNKYQVGKWYDTTLYPVNNNNRSQLFYTC